MESVLGKFCDGLYSICLIELSNMFDRDVDLFVVFKEGCN